MNNREVERKLADAIAKTAPNDINGVLSRISDEKGTVLEVMNTKKNISRYFKGAIAACLALAIMGGGGAYYTRACTVSTVVSFDINPSIELKVNSLEKIISCTALNDEAKEVLADMNGGKDLKGTDIDVAVNALIGALVRNGYLDSISSAILVSVEDKDSDRAAKLRQSVIETVDAVLSANSSSASVLSQTVSKDKKLDELAKKNNISGGKAALVEKVREINPSLEFEALSALSVEELKDLRETGAPALPIGKDKALETALAKAGLVKSQITLEKVKLDTEDGIKVYDVEFYAGNVEYDFEIDAVKGTVLKFEKDGNPDDFSKYIGEAKAKEIALAKAGLAASQVYGFEIELDDGVYEIEFKYNGMEYSMDINAVTGTITDFETEYDD